MSICHMIHGPRLSDMLKLNDLSLFYLSHPVPKSKAGGGVWGCPSRKFLVRVIFPWYVDTLK